jgi:hypothetical protein
MFNYLPFVVMLFYYEYSLNVLLLLHEFFLNQHDEHVILEDEHEVFQLERKIRRQLSVQFRYIGKHVLKRKF